MSFQIGEDLCEVSLMVHLKHKRVVRQRSDALCPIPIRLLTLEICLGNERVHRLRGAKFGTAGRIKLALSYPAQTPSPTIPYLLYLYCYYAALSPKRLVHPSDSATNKIPNVHAYRYTEPLETSPKLHLQILPIRVKQRYWLVSHSAQAKADTHVCWGI